MLLSLLFSAVLQHGYVPPGLLNIVLIPIIKKKNGNVIDRDNYRPIAVSSPICKVLERFILRHLDEFLHTPDNQFGFKKQHGTDLCVFALKEVIRYYQKRGSPVFVAFLDASKALNRVCSLRK